MPTVDEGEESTLAGDGADSARSSTLLKRARSAAGRKAPPAKPLAARAARLGFRLGSLLPLPAAHALGGALGLAAARLPSKPGHVTRTNLALCFPSLAREDRERLARASLAEAGRLGLELGGLWCWSRERTLGLVREVEGEELLREALALGRGAILAVPHLGAWELVGLYCSVRYPMTSLYKPPRMSEMERFYRGARERFGGRLVPAGAGGVLALSRALRRGELAGILPDQDPGRGGGIFVPFFGVLANTSVLLSRIAGRSSAPVLFAYAERLPRGSGFAIRFRRGSEAIGAPDLAASAEALNRDVERLVRERPEQYLWSYKRFRVRPPGEADPYRRRR